MNFKRFLLAGCVVVLSAGTALAGPCDTTGRNSNSKTPSLPKKKKETDSSSDKRQSSCLCWCREVVRR
jgi:hypothetical protein